jgi:sulfur dioxygenase
MIFRQMFDSESSTYTYLLASRHGGEALIIDPVLDRVERYIQLLQELDIKLAKAMDTHLHADHISGIGALRDRTRCVTVMGQETKADVVSIRLSDGDRVEIEGLNLTAIHTPGHTPDSYCFHMDDRVFTGDTLLIRGTGRTDFQGGDARAQYHSIFDKLLKLPDETLVFPAHDYKGETVSTIAEERAFNPRLKARSADEYAAIMASLKLASPKMMDVAIPKNVRMGMAQEKLLAEGAGLLAADAIGLLGKPGVVLVDLRESRERRQHGVIPGALHAPYRDLEENVRPGGMLFELSRATGRRPVFYCAFGERSAMAVMAARAAGLAQASHIHGGIDAWKKAGGPVTDGA